MRQILFASLIFVLFFTLCGAPQPPATGGQPGRIDVAYGLLGENELQRLLRALPTFIEVIEKEGRDFDFKEDPGNLLSAYQSIALLNKEIAELDARLRTAGMGWNEFWPAYGKTMFAYTAILFDSLKGEMKKNEAEMKNMESRLKDPKVSEMEKNILKQSLEAMKAMTKMWSDLDTIYAKVPQANKDLVKRYFKELTNILDRD